MSGEFYELLVV